MDRSIEDIQVLCERYDIAHHTQFRDRTTRRTFYRDFAIETVRGLLGLRENAIQAYPKLDAAAKRWVLWLRQNLVENNAWEPGQIPAPRAAGAPPSRIEVSPLARGYHDRGEAIRQLEARIRVLEASICELEAQKREDEAQDRKRKREVGMVETIQYLRTRSLEDMSLDDLFEVSEHARALESRIVALTKSRLAKMERAEKRAAAEAEAPDGFRCSITADFMTDPVMNQAGHTYERAAIERWFVHNNTDPKTNAVLESKTLIPNHGLRGLIQDFVSKLPQ